MSLSIFPASTYYRDNYEFRDRPGGYKGLGRDKRHEVKNKIVMELLRRYHNRVPYRFSFVPKTEVRAQDLWLPGTIVSGNWTSAEPVSGHDKHHGH